MNVGEISITSLIFAIVMIVPIAPFAIWYCSRTLRYAEPAVRTQILAETRPLAVRLWLAWTAGLVVLGSWVVGEALGYRVLNGEMRFEMGVLLAFHSIWWPFAMRLWNRAHQLATDAGVFASAVPSSVRAASLSPRRLDHYLPSYWIPIIVALSVSETLVLGTWMILHSTIETRLLIMAIGFGGVGLMELVLWFAIMRFEVTTAGEYAGLTPEAAEELRGFRIRCFFWMLLAVSFVFFSVAIGCIEVGRGTIPEPHLGIIGGVLGSLVGIAGGVVGTVASLKANRLRAESMPADSAS